MTFKMCHATNIMTNVKTFVNWHLRYNASIHTHIILSIWPSPNKKFFEYVRHVKKSHEHKKEYTRSPCNVLLWRWLTGFTYQSAAYLSCHLLKEEKLLRGCAALELLVPVTVHDVLWRLCHNSCMQVYRENGWNSQTTCAFFLPFYRVTICPGPFL